MSQDIPESGADAERGKKDGRPLKTILEYAEEKGLLTGVVPDSSLRSTPRSILSSDHSYDMRLSGSVAKGQSILASMVVEGNHAGEEVLVAAQGPGAEKVRGFLRNTQLFEIMMDAFGWERTPHR